METIHFTQLYVDRDGQEKALTVSIAPLEPHDPSCTSKVEVRDWDGEVIESRLVSPIGVGSITCDAGIEYLDSVSDRVYGGALRPSLRPDPYEIDGSQWPPVPVRCGQVLVVGTGDDDHEYLRALKDFDVSSAAREFQRTSDYRAPAEYPPHEPSAEWSNHRFVSWLISSGYCDEADVVHVEFGVFSLDISRGS